MKRTMDPIIPLGDFGLSHLPDLLQKPMFWFSATGAAAFRAITGEPRAWWKRALSFACAIYVAIVFSEPVWSRTGFSRDGIYAVSAVVALTGEHVMALLITLISHPERAIDLWNRFRGRTSP